MEEQPTPLKGTSKKAMLISFRLDAETYASFMAICQSENVPKSVKLRKLILDYLASGNDIRNQKSTGS